MCLPQARISNVQCHRVLRGVFCYSVSCVRFVEILLELLLITVYTFFSYFLFFILWKTYCIIFFYLSALNIFWKYEYSEFFWHHKLSQNMITICIFVVFKAFEILMWKTFWSKKKIFCSHNQFKSFWKCHVKDDFEEKKLINILKT